MKADSNPTNEKTAEAMTEQEGSTKPKSSRKKSSASTKTTSTASSSKRRTSSASKAKQTSTTSTKRKTDTGTQASEKKPSTRRKKTTDGQSTTKTTTRKPSTRRSAKKTTTSASIQPESVETMSVVEPIVAAEASEAIESNDDTLAHIQSLPSNHSDQNADVDVHETEAPQPLEENEPVVEQEVVEDTEAPIANPDEEIIEIEPIQQPDDIVQETGEVVESQTVDFEEEVIHTESDQVMMEVDAETIDAKIPPQSDDHDANLNPEPIESDDEPSDSVSEENSESIPDKTVEPIVSSDDADKKKWYAPVVQTHRRIKDFFQRHYLVKLAVKCLTILLSLCLFLTGVATATYLVFLEYTYVRIEDEEDLEINRPKMWYVSTKTDYTMMSYHIGYGIYDKDFSYLMDKQGRRSGSSNIAEDKADVINNLNGIINAAKQSSCDFYLFQGVDTASTRSHMINEQDVLNEAFRSYSKVFATNYHTKYIFYPVAKNIGTITGGLGTYSRYRIGSAVRRSLPSDASGLSKHSSMDVCASISYLPVRNTQRYLVVINLDLPSYSKQNLDAQWERLKAIMEQEYADGNYVIVGGNWSRDMSGNEPSTDTDMPAWFEGLHAEQMPEHFSVVKPENGTEVASHRSGEQAYVKGTNHESIPDGFIISDNITATASIQDTAYEYSHHNPVVLSFRLNKPKK